MERLGNIKTLRISPHGIVVLRGIWLDRKNNKIDFAEKETSIIYDIDAIDHFEIENALPTKAPEYAMLGAYLINGCHNYIFEAYTYGNNPSAGDIRKLDTKKLPYPKRIIIVRYDKRPPSVSLGYMRSKKTDLPNISIRRI